MSFVIKKLRFDLADAQERAVRLEIEKAELQATVDGLIGILEEFCRDETERRSHRFWWNENEFVSFQT